MTHEAASPQSEIQHQGAPIIYLVDDDPSFLRALSRRLRAADYQVETFGSAEEFLTRRRSDAAGCAVLDLQMPGPGGLELQEALAQAEEPLPVVFLTAHGDISSSVHAMKRGAVDFLTKPVRGDELLDAVQRALARGAAARETQRQKREWGARYESLTPREREVFALVVKGLLNKQIADVLGARERTVKAHRAQVMRKMGVQSPAELGRAVEWLGEIFQAASAADMGATGEREAEKSVGWALRLPPKFAQKYNTK
jgi:FixJ family two-component response regulator